MRYLSRSMAIVCVAVLLLASPAHAAPSSQRPAPKTLTSSQQVVASWLGSLWNEISRLLDLSSTDLSVPSTTTQSGPQPPVTMDLGSCIDPDGCPVN